MAFLAISDKYETFFGKRLQNGRRRPFWMSEIPFWLYLFFILEQYATFFSKWPTTAILEVRFGPFWMTDRYFRSIHNFFLEVRFAPKPIGFFHYVLSMAMPNMKLIGEFMTELEMPQAFWELLYKMAARGHFVFPIDAKNHRVLVIWDLNGYGE